MHVMGLVKLFYFLAMHHLALGGFGKQNMIGHSVFQQFPSSFPHISALDLFDQ